MIHKKVKFWDLGRSKASGMFEVYSSAGEEWFEDFCIQKFKEHLLSSEVSMVEGRIYAGFRAVGRYKFIDVGEKGKDKVISKARD